jgi:hypothetical protein
MSPSKVGASNPGRTSILRPPQSTTSKPRARPAISIGLLPGQLHREKPADLLCFALAQTPSFELALQGAQHQTVIPTKLVLSQSTRFKFKHQPLDKLDLLTASSLSPRDFLVFNH